MRDVGIRAHALRAAEKAFEMAREAPNKRGRARRIGEIAKAIEAELEDAVRIGVDQALIAVDGITPATLALAELRRRLADI